ncbi:MAG: hypothetical protein DWQ06_12585 [Calditrichaeota bacterium]|nr:MAG: hypothetical protein DWQ06_12585 [Calditrichota bacterium]
MKTFLIYSIAFFQVITFSLIFDVKVSETSTHFYELVLNEELINEELKENRITPKIDIYVGKLKKGSQSLLKDAEFNKGFLSELVRTGNEVSEVTILVKHEKRILKKILVPAIGNGQISKFDIFSNTLWVCFLDK